MARLGVCTCFILVTVLNFASTQLPPRLNIPGAVLLPQPKQQQQVIRQRLQQQEGPQPRLRSRPPQAYAPPANVRPVVEEPEEEPHSSFDEEVARLGLQSIQPVPQHVDEEPEQRPVVFRPERPIPLLRQDIRENRPPQPKPLPILRQDARPVIRQELKQDTFAPRPAPPRQEFREEQPVHVRRPLPPPQQQQPIRQQARPAQPRPAPRPAPQYLDHNEPTRTRKPPIQILRKYRTDNADGSITWGYENEDGTFKEETIGIDCITRGKYGYVDPDGVRREYSYETGGKCEDPDELEELPAQPAPSKGGAKKPYRPAVQYVN